jgi:hypothetical protein
MAQIDGSRLSISSCCLWYAVVFVGYMLCVFCLHELDGYEHTPAKYVSLLIFAQLLLIWVGYWAVLVASPYLRPRSILRHCGLVVLSYGAVLVTFVCAFCVFGSIYGH